MNITPAYFLDGQALLPPPKSRGRASITHHSLNRSRNFIFWFTFILFLLKSFSMKAQLLDSLSWTEIKPLKVPISPDRVPPTTKLANENDLIKIYPNPASDYLFIENNSIESVQVINSYGEPVLNKIISGNYTLDIKTLTPGYYLLTLLANDGNRYIKSFIKI